MTKYTRLTGKVFGSSATATGDDPEIGQFGSALAGTYNGTTDVATIQNLPAWQKGFIGCVTPTTQFPPLPEMTGFGKVLSHQICYLLQQGVPEWDSGTTYYINGWCSYNGSLYISKTDENLNNLPTNTTYWDKFTGGFSRNYGEIVTSSLPIVDDNTLHLADGSLLSQQNYPDFVSYVANLYNSLPSGEFGTPIYITNDTTSVSWKSIAYGNGKYIAVRSDNSSNYAISENGTNWNIYTTNISFVPRSIVYDGSKFLVISTGGDILTSEDGINWTEQLSDMPSGYSWINIAYGNGKYIAISGTGTIAISTNGITGWTELPNSAYPDGKPACDSYHVGITYGNGIYMIVDSVLDVFISDNANIWYKKSNIANVIADEVSVCFDGTYFTVLDASGYMAKSDDGINWSNFVQNPILGNRRWQSLSFGNSKIVALSWNADVSVKEIPYTEVFTTEAEWQTSYTTHGECGKYVYNSSANTVRIPLYNSYFTNTANPQSLGTITEASLPNIKGAFNLETTDGYANGAFAIGPSVPGKNAAPGGDTDHEISFNAGYYNSIYKDSATTVNTQSIKQLVYIVVAK